MPAIVSGFLLGVTLSLDDLVITSFLSGPGSSTLPQVIFSKIKLGLDPQMNVLATIIIAIVGTFGYHHELVYDASDHPTRT